MSLPPRQGLYDPNHEHDSCGIGFVANIKGRKSHDIVRQGLQILINLDHRGAVGADPLTGDGAGILIQTPDAFLRAVCQEQGLTLPAFGQYAVGMIFLPRQEKARTAAIELIERMIKLEGQKVLGWRQVPVDRAGLGETVKNSEPDIRQIFIGRAADIADVDTFERRLFVIRKQIQTTSTTMAQRGEPEGINHLYIPSMSSRTLVYKGLLLAGQVGSFYEDLRDERLVSALALVHQRFSTNTFPSWRLAHPYRMVCHNG